MSGLPRDAAEPNHAECDLSAGITCADRYSTGYPGHPEEHGVDTEMELAVLLDAARAREALETLPDGPRELVTLILDLAPVPDYAGAIPPTYDSAGYHLGYKLRGWPYSAVTMRRWYRAALRACSGYITGGVPTGPRRR